MIGVWILAVTAAVLAGAAVWMVLSHQAQNKETSRRLETMTADQQRVERMILDEASRTRTELGQQIAQWMDRVGQQVLDAARLQQQELTNLTRLNEQKLENIRQAVETHLRALQDDNARRLEQMRMTVDEKLHATLERRLGESFQLVSERLEKVHQGLGEMQTLAAGVGDLKRVLSNVKTRGTWGEVQLSQLLEQILTPDQYVRDVVTKRGSRDRVEFAIRLPGKNDEAVLIPIDSKFPLVDYERLQDAQERADPAGVEEAGRALEIRLKQEAKAIHEKYLDPPQTTDFALLFIPIEGLYAEVLRRPGLVSEIQRLHRVVVTGPTTLAATLMSLQMGFRTLAVERRAHEVWTLLGQVKAEFGRFGDLLEKTHKKLGEASRTIEDATRKTRTIERKLRDVQVIPVSPSDKRGPVLDLMPPGEEEEA